ncbi:MAG TPA: hypothetical protein DF712_01415 [Balneola sp.]|nr:hypothetical protein [Balneola sp.]
MKNFLHQISKNFLLNEVHKPTPKVYLQSLQELIEKIKPKSKADLNRIQLAKEHVRNLKNQFRKLQEQVDSLEEQLKVLEENRGKK